MHHFAVKYKYIIHRAKLVSIKCAKPQLHVFDTRKIPSIIGNEHLVETRKEDSRKRLQAPFAIQVSDIVYFAMLNISPMKSLQIPNRRRTDNALARRTCNDLQNITQ